MVYGATSTQLVGGYTVMNEGPLALAQDVLASTHVVINPPNNRKDSVMETFIGVVVGIALLVSLVWWRADPKGCPKVIKFLGPIAVALWVLGKVLNNLPR
jgi:hypothetical protein